MTSILRTLELKVWQVYFNRMFHFKMSLSRFTFWVRGRKHTPSCSSSECSYKTWTKCVGPWFETLKSKEWIKNWGRVSKFKVPLNWSEFTVNFFLSPGPGDRQSCRNAWQSPNFLTGGLKRWVSGNKKAPERLWRRKISWGHHKVTYQLWDSKICTWMKLTWIIICKTLNSA